jgi:hypothetical protein
MAPASTAISIDYDIILHLPQEMTDRGRMQEWQDCTHALMNRAVRRGIQML